MTTAPDSILSFDEKCLALKNRPLNQDQAAKELQINRRTLIKKLHKLGTTWSAQFM